MATGLTSIARSATSSTITEISGALSSDVVTSLNAMVATRSTSTTTQATTNALSSATAIASSGSGLTSIANELATSLLGGVTGSISGSLGNISSILSSGLPIFGSASALASSLSSLGGASQSQFNGWPQIPAAAKGLQQNGPTPPPNFNLGPLGNVVLTDQLGNIYQLFNAALAAMQSSFSSVGQK